jgi:cell filamentation protein
MRNKPGEIMGLFAYGHPFLDGNGRTMLIVHSELCNRAGFSITWEKSNKDSYLIELTKEIANPGKGILDAYLKPLISGAVTKDFWKRTIHDLPGLNGRSTELRIEGDTSDPAIAKRYEELEAQRAYRIG